MKRHLPKIGILIFCALIFTKFSLNATVNDTLPGEIEIWPGVGPGSDSLDIVENILIRSLDGSCTRNWAIEKVTTPTITPMVPENPNGSAVILCPGGAYMRVVYDVEGIDIGRYLNTIGITAFVLKYRLPQDQHENNENVPLQDAQRAMRYVRTHAAEWNLDTAKIGVLGASAGGHMASTLGTQYEKEAYTYKDTVDDATARPDFMILLYPVVTMNDTYTHATTRKMLLGDSPSQALKDEFSAEKNVTSNSPATFLAHAKDDGSVNPENSKMLYQALIDSNVVAALKLYKNGGHGVGICKAVGTDFENWTIDCTNWLNELGLTDSTAYRDTVEEPIDTTSIIINNTGDIIRVYPNPITYTSVLLFESSADEKVNISILSADGKVVNSFAHYLTKSDNNTVPIGTYTEHLKGLYILKVEGEYTHLIHKILIE